jgi:predicted DNA-binding protein (MmcQ/YjbR family)
MMRRLRRLMSLYTQTKLLVWDLYGFGKLFDYEHLLEEEGFTVTNYDDVEGFRYLYESELRDGLGKYAVIVRKDIYVPYDVKSAWKSVNLSLEHLYPRLNKSALVQQLEHLELIDMAYDSVYSNLSTYDQTESFIQDIALSKSNVQKYLSREDEKLLAQAQSARNHHEWIDIAKKNAMLSYYSLMYGTSRDTLDLNTLFGTYIDEEYANLSGVVSSNFPAILTKTLPTIASGKTALIVIDGMSMADYEMIKRTNWPFDSEDYGSFALIPSTTSISRQSLLTGLYPSQMENQFSLAKEERGFYQAAEKLGYAKTETFYGRSYDVDLHHQVKLAAIILNDIDDIMHGQQQGDVGMGQDVRLMAQQGKLQQLIRRLLSQNFVVYMTSDHGHISSEGNGITKRFGLETEAKALRVIVLKDFAEASDEIKEAARLFPGTYLDKSFQYYIAKDNKAFAALDRKLVTHGGISLEEVIVPFIKIEGVK